MVKKRGRPVSVLRLLKRKAWKSPKGAWAGKVKIVVDIVNFDLSRLWKISHGPKHASPTSAGTGAHSE